MRKQIFWTLSVVFVLIASACGGASTPAPAATAAPVATAADQSSAASDTAQATPTASDAETAAQEPAAAMDEDTPVALSDILSDTYDDALSVRNQLALGIIELEDTATPVTAAQAKELNLYWQALQALGDSPTTATEETTAVQTQIIEALTREQLQAVAAMQLTNADLNTFYTEQGVVLTTPEPGVTPQSGKNSGLSPEDREATRTASEALGTPVATGGGTGAARRDVLIDAVIVLLATRAAE